MRPVLTGLAAALVLLGAAAGCAPAPSAPTTGETPAPASSTAPAAGGGDVAAEASGAIGTGWTTETVALAWDGEPYTTAERSFVGVPVTVPGDRAGRTLRVRNDGPTVGTLRAWVQEVDLATPVDGFYEDLRLGWATASSTGAGSFRDLAAAGRTQVAEVALVPGESTDITVAYEFPRDSVTGNRAEVGAREASFVVHLEIAGDLPDQAAGVRRGPLAMTGAELLHAALLGLGALGVGGLLVAAVRRRRPGGPGPEAPGPA